MDNNCIYTNYNMDVIAFILIITWMLLHLYKLYHGCYCIYANYSMDVVAFIQIIAWMFLHLYKLYHGCYCLYYKF